MAICLDYQPVYAKRRDLVISHRLQIIVALLLMMTLSFKVLVKVEITDLGYDMAKARQHSIELDMERRELELQLSVLQRPDTLAKVARERLGFQNLDPQQARKIEY